MKRRLIQITQVKQSARGFYIKKQNAHSSQSELPKEGGEQRNERRSQISLRTNFRKISGKTKKGSRKNLVRITVKISSKFITMELESPMLLMQYIEGVDGSEAHYITLSRKQIKDIMISLAKGLQCLNEKMHRFHGGFLVSKFCGQNIKANHH